MSRIFLLLACLLNTNPASAAPSYNIDTSCYQSGEGILPSLYGNSCSFKDRKVSTQALIPSSSGHGIMHLSGWREKTPLVFIFVHGLGMDNQQMKHLQSNFFHKGFNVISLDLSGHGEDEAQANERNINSWEEDMNAAIKEASELGEKIVLVGHSTGGMLALAQSLQQNNDIAAMALIEPAVRVNNIATNASCLLSEMGISSTKPIANVANKLGIMSETFRKDAPSVSTKMGCEVSELRTRLVKQFSLEKLSEIEQTAQIAKKIKAATLVFNNESDLVVDPTHNKALCENAETNQSIQCVKINAATTHGMVLETKEGLKQLEDTFSQFLQQRFPFSFLRSFIPLAFCE